MRVDDERRCADCAREKLAAFSCKRRGLCPSCGARRMAETGAHLVDYIIPLRIRLAAPPQRLSPVLQIVHRVIVTFLIKQSGIKRALKRDEAHTGAVTLIQRFGCSAEFPDRTGWRGATPGDLSATAEVVSAVLRFTTDFVYELSEIEINPLAVLPQGEGCLALDCVIRPRISSERGGRHYADNTMP